eukprot:Hpha_TRINITY_DN33663_c0_g1::TRINITY_DN33663_c0_g1_i1::g.43170::m.43170/K13985/NAPEPLD; N-acyl-phosphatidylethanolamine-hydrolysing phospholipase D
MPPPRPQSPQAVARTPPVQSSIFGMRVRYNNPYREWRERGLTDVVRWQCGRKGDQGKEPSEAWVTRNIPSAPTPSPEFLRQHPPPGTVRVYWVGHATLLVQCGGVNVLTDPVFAERCSPVSFHGPRRLQPPSIPIESLPPLHAVTVSHNHYDHLCADTVSQILVMAKSWPQQPRWFTTAGMEQWFTKMGVKPAHVRGLSWWEKDTRLQVPGIGKVSVTLAPAQHWSVRSGLDRNASLWGSFVIDFPPPSPEARSPRVFVCGDTGYSRQLFRELSAAFAPVDVALIPIGAYCPRWFMRPQHIDPQEAVQLHVDLGCKRSIPMHWGTFVLSDEPVLEPPELLERALRRRGLDPSSFGRVQHGEAVLVEARRDVSEWERGEAGAGGPPVPAGHTWVDWGSGAG